MYIVYIEKHRKRKRKKKGDLLTTQERPPSNENDPYIQPFFFSFEPTLAPLMNAGQTPSI
ncbi:hypothetical protein I7I50_02759 [Histoplasma capsulatum G186AR]|uniref:Uncharacterized protein n=1 Tax=Ajellomyces capsulatus TaxID=5037 RepID=A0A8H7Z6Q3_AJECA|nr:hypothetical protein I7I52_00575 [Histoplasma capsulatum]QSS71783.1 hypothetical protein I7I50_02759 [Histoplasma capsulatum G186AR]